MTEGLQATLRSLGCLDDLVVLAGSGWDGGVRAMALQAMDVLGITDPTPRVVAAIMEACLADDDPKAAACEIATELLANSGVCGVEENRN